MSEIPYDSDMTYDSNTTYDGITTDVITTDLIFLGSTPVKLYLGDLAVSEEILVGVS
jgi:hypothetical protein